MGGKRSITGLTKEKKMSSIGRVPNPISGQSLSTSSSPVATVQVGETQLSQVAQRLGVNADDLAAANPHISDPAKLTTGQDIILPKNTAVPAAGPQSGGSSAGNSDLPPSPLGDPMTKSFVQADLAAKSRMGASGPPAGSPAAFDTFLHLGGINGDSLQSKSKDWIEVSSFSFGEANTGKLTGATGKEATAGNSLPAPEYKSVNFGDIKGESQDDKHKDWIEVSSFGFGEANTGKPTGPSGKEATAGNSLPAPEYTSVNFADIKGESLDDKHKDWIETVSFDHTAVDPGAKK
jgi:type VI protein secretion system component Hcp